MISNKNDRDRPLEEKTRLITGELKVRFPDSEIKVQAWRRGDDTGIRVTWVDGVSLAKMIETMVRERFGLVIFGWPSCYIQYRRDYSPETLKLVESRSPWCSYDFALLAETSFDQDGRPIDGILAETWRTCR